MTFVLLVPLLPLLAALGTFGRDAASVRSRAQVAFWAFALAFLGAVAALVRVTISGGWVLRSYIPGTLASLVLPLGMQVDRLSAVMMVLIAGVGTLIYRYSISYMDQDPAYGRFLSLIGVTTSVLLAMVASPNLLMLFLGWQLLSYLLSMLAHNLGHGPTLEGARRTFRWLRVGDAVFFLGIALAYSLYGTVEFGDLFARAALKPGMLWLPGGVGIPGPTAVTLLLVVGAMIKSAQFPVHVWLPRSLYAPTPVAGLLHAGIINAAGFLINRLSPLYGQSPLTLHVAFAVGALTALFGATTMLTQTDIKKTLGFSTISQMGYMVMECGLGAFALAVFHLIAHGLFKATAFLNCGDVVHRARQEPARPAESWEPGSPRLSRLTWATGCLTTLVMPLVILLVAHGALRLPLLASQGSVIFLFFIWVTSSQAIMTLTRLRAVASWEVAAMMLATILAVVVTYLFAAERFTAFLYPDPRSSAAFFRAAAVAGPLFDGIVVGAALAIVAAWTILYARTQGHRLRLPGWADALASHLYVVFLNHLYVERLWAALALRIGRPQSRVAADRLGGSSRRSVKRLGAGLALFGLAMLGLVPIGIFSALLAVLLRQGAPGGIILAVVAWVVASWSLFDRMVVLLGGRSQAQS